MKVIHKAIAREHIWSALVLLAFLTATAPRSNAKPRPVKPSEQPATVIAHLALLGTPTSQMFLRENNSKQYLYIGTNAKEGLTVVDVTNPAEPNIIKQLAWPNEASTGTVQVVNGGLALAEGPDSGSVVIAPSTRTLKILDLSDPANPRAVLSFSGVTSTLDDDARDLVYIANGEGLWILRNNQALAAAAKVYACTSDEASNEVASCQ
jgi:hypothetical protein